MNLFLLTFFFIYSGCHFYVLMKTRALFRLTAGWVIVLAFFMFLMVFAPIIVRILEGVGYDIFATIMAYIGYGWMSILFLFFSTLLLINIGRLAVYLIGLVTRHDFSSITSASRQYFILALMCAASVTIYGFVDAQNIRIEHIVIKTDKLSKEAGSIRIAQVSDIHLGLIIGEERLKKILDKVAEINPDVLVSTGDLLDGRADSMDAMITLFNGIMPRFGKFAVTGNHEFYAGIAGFTSFAERAGFKVLRGEGIVIDGVMNIAGIDDIAGRDHPAYRNIEERVLLSNLPGDRFNLLLKHRPLINRDTLGLFDLQLSGHTHKGQIFPFSYIAMLPFPFLSGYFYLGKGSHLYVSRGTGTWGPPVRFLSSPEVTLIELKNDKF
ncbi:MAG: metallophosphoesterase [Syntrophus sp. (in: bacteria)]|nr:metallophosphoesterase [Syntrophus sp. (in: bacteria)]